MVVHVWSTGVCLAVIIAITATNWPEYQTQLNPQSSFVATFDLRFTTFGQFIEILWVRSGKQTLSYYTGQGKKQQREDHKLISCLLHPIKLSERGSPKSTFAQTNTCRVDLGKFTLWIWTAFGIPSKSQSTLHCWLLRWWDTDPLLSSSESPL